MKRWLLSSAVLVAGLGLWACSPIKLPAMSSYTLMSTHPFHVPRHSQTDQTVYVEMPTASPGFETTDMIYVTTPLKLSAFTQNRWVAPPAEMLQALAAQALRARGYFKAVMTTPVAVKFNYRVAMQLLQLQQEFVAGSSQVRLGVQATLVDNTSGHALASQRFEVVVPAGAATPYAGVVAANQAATAVSTQLAAFVLHHVNQN